MIIPNNWGSGGQRAWRRKKAIEHGPAPPTTYYKLKIVGRQAGQLTVAAAACRWVKGGGRPEENYHTVPSKAQVPRLYN